MECLTPIKTELSALSNGVRDYFCAPSPDTLHNFINNTDEELFEKYGRHITPHLAWRLLSAEPKNMVSAVANYDKSTSAFLAATFWFGGPLVYMKHHATLTEEKYIAAYLFSKSFTSATDEKTSSHSGLGITAHDSGIAIQKKPQARDNLIEIDVDLEDNESSSIRRYFSDGSLKDRPVYVRDVSLQDAREKAEQFVSVMEDRKKALRYLQNVTPSSLRDDLVEIVTIDAIFRASLKPKEWKEIRCGQKTIDALLNEFIQDKPEIKDSLTKLFADNSLKKYLCPDAEGKHDVLQKHIWTVTNPGLAGNMESNVNKEDEKTQWYAGSLQIALTCCHCAFEGLAGKK